jgi:16S rRNA G966 N2-methylase RsmD
MCGDLLGRQINIYSMESIHQSMDKLRNSVFSWTDHIPMQISLKLDESIESAYSE